MTHQEWMRWMFPKTAIWHSAQFGRLVGTIAATPFIFWSTLYGR